MKVVITGGGGFLGRKLAGRLLDRETLTGPDGRQQKIEHLVLFDQVEPPPELASDPRVKVVVGDVTDRATIDGVIGKDTSSVFHLAAVVSAGAEADFDLGYRVNLDGTRHVLEACRALPAPARLVFTSSIAVYGGELPDVVVDETPLVPQTSYGAQKATAELLINDYSRKGFLDGRSIRLPTVVVRPGKPNLAASGFASSIIREPLVGIDFSCPVSPESSMALMSPRRIIDCLVHMHELDGDRLGQARMLLLTGIRVTMGEAAEAVQRVGQGRQLGRITFDVDPVIQAIVDNWPRETRSARAARLGFPQDRHIDEIVRAHIEDELS